MAASADLILSNLDGRTGTPPYERYLPWEQCVAMSTHSRYGAAGASGGSGSRTPSGLSTDSSTEGTCGRPIQREDFEPYSKISGKIHDEMKEKNVKRERGRTRGAPRL